MVVCKNRDVVVALREIAAGKVLQGTGEEGDHLDLAYENPTVDELPGPAEDSPPTEAQEDEEAGSDEK
jgi:hypothetical protein